MHASVAYWVNAAREQSRWFVQLRRAYHAEQHGKRRARLWQAGNRCRDRVKPFMAEARRMRAEVARLQAVQS